jgi:hypothetical protein
MGKLNNMGGGSIIEVLSKNKTKANANKQCLFTDIEDLSDIEAFTISDVEEEEDNNDKLIEKHYYFNNFSPSYEKYIFTIKKNNSKWKLKECFKQKMNYLYKTSIHFEKLGGSSTNIFHLNSEEFSYFLRYYYMYAILDTLKNVNNELSEHLCSLINTLNEFVEENNDAVNINKKIKSFLKLFEKV